MAFDTFYYYFRHFDIVCIHHNKLRQHTYPMVRWRLSLMFLYMVGIPSFLLRSNRDNELFLKRLAFHLQYRLMAIIGCSIVRNPPTSSNDDPVVENDEASCYHVAGKIFTFNASFYFIRLHGRKKKKSTT